MPLLPHTYTHIFNNSVNTCKKQTTGTLMKCYRFLCGVQETMFDYPTIYPNRFEFKVTTLWTINLVESQNDDNRVSGDVADQETEEYRRMNRKETQTLSKIRSDTSRNGKWSQKADVFLFFRMCNRKDRYFRRATPNV